MQGAGNIDLNGGYITSSGSTSNPLMEIYDQTISGYGRIQGSVQNDSGSIIDANLGLLIVGDDRIVESAFKNEGLLEATSNPNNSDATYLEFDDVVDNNGTIAAKGNGYVIIQSTGVVVGGSVVVQGDGLLDIEGVLTDINPSSHAAVVLNVTASDSSWIKVTDDLIGANVQLSGTSHVEIWGSVIGGSLTAATGATIFGYGGTLDGSTSVGAVTLSGSTQINTITGGAADENNSLTLLGVIDNTGTITLASADTNVSLLAGDAAAKITTLQGAGKVVMTDGDDTIIDAGVKGDTLINVDDTISGNGTIGTGNLIFDNGGIVDATGGSPLFIELSTATASANSGNLEATGGGDLELEQGVIVNSDYVEADDAIVAINRLVKFTNNGSVVATDGGVVSIGAAAGNIKDFTNGASGSVRAILGGQVTIGAGASSNDVGGTLTGGAWTAGSLNDTTTSTLTFADAFTKLAASLFVAGKGQVVDGGATLEQELTDIAVGGVLGVERAYTTTNAISVEGTLRLDGFTFTSGLITATGAIQGDGTLASALNSSTGVSVIGQPLTLTGADTLSGAIAGLGTVAFSGNKVTLNTGAALNAASVTFTNSTVSVNANVAQAAKTGPATTSFSETTSALSIASGDTLSFVSAATFVGGSVSGAGTLQFGGAATATFQSVVTLSVAFIRETGAASLSFTQSLAYAGAFEQDAGAKLTIAGGETLALSGVDTLAGSTIGGGTLALSGGDTTFATGASLSTAVWKLSGSGTTATVVAKMTFAGAFSASAGTRVNLSGGSLVLEGAATLAGLTVNSASPYALNLRGPTSVSGLAIAGDASVYNYATTSQSGGSITVGDSVATHMAELSNTTTGVWNITDNSGIAVGADKASIIQNGGLFEKTGGTGISKIAAAVTNSGTLLAKTGTLDCNAAISGTGAANISGAAVLEFDAGVVATQTIGFTGAGGELSLQAPTGFKAEISGFDASGATGDAIALLGNWTVGHFTEATNGKGGTLALTSGTTALTLNFLGQYQDGHFHAMSASGQTTLSYA
jgi:hypothetical protein